MIRITNPLRSLCLSLCLPLGVAAAPLAWACEAPQPPADIPAGAGAERAQLLAAHRQVWDYVEAAERYLDCLDQQEHKANAQGRETPAARARRINAYNHTVQTMHQLTAQLGDAIAAFRAR